MEAENRDFKYVLQDTGKIYIGARYTYGEMLEEDAIPFKFKAVISHYIIKEVAEDTAPESHIFYLKETDISYMAYHQLKAKFKLSVYGKAGEEGRRKAGYKSLYYRIEDIVNNASLKEKKDNIVVEEMMISKLSLMMMGV